VFDENYILKDAGAMRVPDNAGFDPGMEIAVNPQQIAFANPIRPQQKGYIYIWVSNESENTKVWFDDLKVTHRSRRVTQATDYYAYGSVLREQKTPEELTYRYKYQGQYAEKDEETGWSHFELREWDPILGRWLVRDPERQHYSPFVGMGNNPVSGVDPDGGWVKGAGLWSNMFKSDSRIYSEQFASSWSSNLVDYTAFKAGNAWGVMAIDKALLGNQRYSTFTSVTGVGTLGGTDGAFETRMLATGQIDFDPMTQLTLGLFAVNGAVTVGSKFLSVGTAPGRSLFWSGVRSSAAADFATANGLTTLEMTTAGSFLNATQGAVLPIFRSSLWTSMSGRFAAGASGNVRALIGSTFRGTASTFIRAERPILMNSLNSGRVTNLTYYIMR